MDIFNLFDIALHAAGSLVPDPKSFKTVIKKQEDVLDELKKEITLTDEEKERIRMTYREKNQEVIDDKNLVKLWHRAQRIRTYLSYYVNKLGDAPDPFVLRSIGSSREFNKNPEDELKAVILIINKGPNRYKKNINIYIPSKKFNT